MVQDLEIKEDAYRSQIDEYEIGMEDIIKRVWISI